MIDDKSASYGCSLVRVGRPLLLQHLLFAAMLVYLYADDSVLVAEVRRRMAPSVQCTASSAVKCRVVPTLDWTYAAGSWRASSCVARQPVQWPGATTVRWKAASAPSVGGMIPSKRPPVRCKPPMKACTVRHPAHAPCMAQDVDRTCMAATRKHHQPQSGHMDNHAVIIPNPGVRLPMAVCITRLLQREALFEVCDARHLAGHEHRIIQHQRRATLLKDIPPFTIKIASVGRRHVDFDTGWKDRTGAHARYPDGAPPAYSACPPAE